MRIDKVYIEDFKNLKQFSIDLDENEMKTVLLGQNAVGKSNFMEALILIFKFLDLSNDTKREPTPFEYYIKYQKGEYYIEISYKKGTYTILVNNEKIKSLKSFFSKEGKELYQPKYVFTYYSGLSNRIRLDFLGHKPVPRNLALSLPFSHNRLIIKFYLSYSNAIFGSLKTLTSTFVSYGFGVDAVTHRSFSYRHSTS